MDTKTVTANYRNGKPVSISRWYVVNVLTGKFLAWNNTWSDWGGAEDLTNLESAKLRAKRCNDAGVVVFKLEE
jgi:hypothetical protein